MSNSTENQENLSAPIEKEIDSFTAQQKEIRSLINAISGATNRKKDRVINYLFLALITAIFCVEIFTDILPPLVSLEIGILLVSVKIVWMIHMQSRFQHFTFWVLNAIEHKLNLIDGHIRSIDVPPPLSHAVKNKQRKRKGSALRTDGTTPDGAKNSA